MKVLVVSTLYPMWSDDPTGVFVKAQVAALENLGVDVRVIVPLPFAPPGAGRRRRRWNARPSPNHKHLIVVPTFGIPRGSRLTASAFGHVGSAQAVIASRTIEKWLDGWEPDIVHAHQVLPEGQFAEALAERTGWSSRVIATVHGADLHSTQRGSLPSLARQLARLDRTIVATSSMKQRVTSMQPIASVSVIPPGVPNLASARETPAAVQWDVTSVGRLVPIKAMERLFPVAAAGHSVAIAGDGPELSRLEAAAPPGVEFVGAIPPASVRRFMQGGRIYAQLSLWDGYGIAAAEAMRWGRPVVLADTVGLSEYVANGIDGLIVHAGNPAEVLGAVDSLLKNPAQATHMGERGSELIASHSASCVAERLIKEVYGGA
ncbi:MAG: glycosyltransferase family 4 protein [Actinomycetota bacterium]|nr:glycosyltransferase family 4 protein [Actinomycetota bacterium]